LKLLENLDLEIQMLSYFALLYLNFVNEVLVIKKSLGQKF